MRKFYFACVLVLLVFVAHNTYAQAPVIAYPAGSGGIFPVGTPITPQKLTNTGGAIPNLIYSKTTTIAGNGQYGDKDTLALYSMFEGPASIAMDLAGNMYVADANLNQIRKISTTGVVSLIAGSPKGDTGRLNGKDTAARFNYPTGIAVDNTGSIYVADFNNSLIRKIFPNGTVTTFAGNINFGQKNGTGINASFNYPHSIIFDKSGNLLVADTYNNKIRKITPAGVVTTLAGSGAVGLKNGKDTVATFNTPYGIAVNAAGDIFIADQGNNCIREIAAGVDTVSTFSPSTNGFNLPVSLTVDKLNQVYVSSQDNYHIIKLDSHGNITGSPYTYFSGGDLKHSVNGTDTLTKYIGGMGLTYDDQNSLLIADPGGARIRKIAINGYSVYPRLSAGLSIDSTGTISGTPTVATSTSPPPLYRITGYNNSGSSFTMTFIGASIAPQTITFNPLPVKTYGNADFSPGATGVDTVNKITYTSSNPAVATIVNNKIHIVSAGNSIITANQAGNANYTAAAPVALTLQVTSAILTIRADNLIKTVGNDNPTLTVSYHGFVNGDTTTVIKTKPTIQTTAVTASPVGTYPITASGAVADNYSFSYAPGTLTVFPIPTIAATGSTTIIKGDSVLLTATPASGYTYQWQFNATDITGATSSTYEAKQTGVYTVSITANSYTTYSTPTPVYADLILPVNNFTVKINSISCKGSNNGSIRIGAVQKLKYTAALTGNNLNTSYNFTDTLLISNLSPGNYSVCISVAGEIYSQCYQLSVTEPKDLSVYSTINKTLNTLNLQLNGGSSYNIVLNNVTYNTTQTDVTLPLTAGINKLTVTTDRICQGYIEKIIDASDNLTPYPNPFQNTLNVNVGNQPVGNMQVDIVSLLDGKSAYKNQYTNQSGVIQFDLSALKDGFYYININLDDNKYGYKIIKK